MGSTSRGEKASQGAERSRRNSFWNASSRSRCYTINATRKSLAFLAAVLLASIACETPPTLNRDAARAAIEKSDAFKGSWNPATRIDGSPLAPDPSWHREIINVRGLEVRGSGATAVGKVGFTWRWNAGPFEGADFKATALFLYSEATGWSLQEKKLRNEIWKQEARAE